MSEEEIKEIVKKLINFLHQECNGKATKQDILTIIQILCQTGLYATYGKEKVTEKIIENIKQSFILLKDDIANDNTTKNK